jgi:predicted Zn-dependent peptidase
MAVDRSGLPTLGPEPGFRFPEIHRTVLANGLRVWTVEHRQVPLVALLALVPVGASSDPTDRPGLAAITGDMLDEGAGDRSALEIHEALGRIGSQLDLEVGHDATVLALTTLERYVDRGLELIRDMLARPRFEQREFDRVRELRLNRLLQLKDMPPALADRAFAQLLYRGHPYGHLPIGSEGSLRSLMIRDIAGFHRRAFVPARTTVIAVGDAPHETLTNAVRAAFEGWTAESDGGVADPAAFPDPPPPSARLALVHRPGAAQSELRLGHVALPRKSPDYHAALVANVILGGQFVSRINMNLREDKGYTYGARTAFEFRRAPGPFVLHASVQADATADALKEAIGEIRGIRGERPITRAELDLGRASLTRGYPRSFETADQIARAAAQLALYELPDDYFSSFIAKVLSLGEAEVTAAAARHIDPARLIAVVVGDRDKLTAPLKTLDLGEVADVSVT